MMRKNPFKVDERDMNIFRKVCTIMYIITIYALIGIQLYRQFVLNQPREEWEDIAIVLTVNIIICLGAILYIGGHINFGKIKWRYVIIGYIGFVLFGFTFTIIKYTVLLDQSLNLTQVLNYLFTVLVISALLAIVLGILAYLGNRRIEKHME